MLGAVKGSEVEANVDDAATDVPTALFDELKAAGLLDPAAPTEHQGRPHDLPQVRRCDRAFVRLLWDRNCPSTRSSIASAWAERSTSSRPRSSRFDTEAASQSLSRAQGIARLEGNGDPLAQQRGTAVEDSVARKDRLEQQRLALATSGPVSQYAVLADGLDRGIARQALAAYQPAVPATQAGFIAAAIAFVIGWVLIHLIVWPLRRRRRDPAGTLA